MLLLSEQREPDLAVSADNILMLHLPLFTYL
jgi:hypothetical protein